MIAPALDNNPRRIKQFINLFRLRTFIANETGLFDFTDENEASFDRVLTLQQLGKFVAISIRWPLLIADLDRNPTFLGELQEIAEEHKKPSGNMWSNEAIYWSTQDKLIELLVSYGSNDNDTSEIIFKKKQQCDVSKLNIERLLQVSPRVVQKASTLRGDTLDEIKNIEKEPRYETNAAEKKTLALGESWNIEDGWVLTVQSIDAKATPRQVWLVLSKDGVKKDDKVVSEGQTYTYAEKNIADEYVPRLVISVGTVFVGTNSSIVELKLILKEKKLKDELSF